MHSLKAELLYALKTDKKFLKKVKELLK